MSCETADFKQIALACDHAGFQLKEIIREHLNNKGLTPVDMGTDSELPVDYPDFAKEVCEALIAGSVRRGILICGTGIGMSMMANRYKGIRAALCHDQFTALASRQHNDANVLALGGRTIGPEIAIKVLETWLETTFEGGRHERRIAKFDE
jgi:ribose 5-phosphate isomerase B